MLERVISVAPTVLNFIIYVSSPTLAYVIKDCLKKSIGVKKDFIVDVDTAKALNSAKLDAYVAPLTGGKWMINVDADKISSRELESAINKANSHSVTIYWVSKYNVYKRLRSLKSVKKQGVYCQDLYFGKLSYSDIIKLHKLILGDNKKLDKDLLHYVAKNYNYDVESVCKLFTSIRSGEEIETKADIIKLVGVGGNSVDNLVISLLRANYKTEKGKKQVITKNLKLLEDLSYSYQYSTIRNFMLGTIDGFIEMKQLQIMGYYRKYTKRIPESFDEKRLNRLRRFERVVLEDVSLPRLLNLKLCLRHFNNYDTQAALTLAIINYVESLNSVVEEVNK